MVGILTIDSPKSDSERWKHIDWKKAETIVNRIQVRIVKAIKAGNKNKVRSLQRLLARSFAAKLKAVKRIISNRGRNTAGVDGVKWNTPAKRWKAVEEINRKDYKPQPLKRNIPMNKNKLRMWLKAGYMEEGSNYPTPTGTPQGGIISPILANMALDGLETLLAKHFKKRDKVHFVRFADDFVITGATKRILEDEVMPLVKKFLRVRGLELSETKTKISHINDGFDFLGFSVKKYKGKLLIKPAKSKVDGFIEKIRQIIKSNKNVKTRSLIYQLNPVIRGWGYFYRHVVSSQIFSELDHRIWETTWQWAKRRHPNKGKQWIKRKYYQHEGNRNWIFREKNDKMSLFLLSKIHIIRHVKIQSNANPYDPDWKEYFVSRSRKKKGNFDRIIA
jgi:RNA-directed DNA polymerase